MKETNTIKTVVSVVDIETGVITDVAEKDIDIDWKECEHHPLQEELAKPLFHGNQEKFGICEKYQLGLIIPTEEIFQTTIISNEIFKKVYSQNIKLQTVIQQVRVDHPVLLEITPLETVVEVIGDKTIFTMTFSE